jgi:hypothetical protein
VCGGKRGLIGIIGRMTECAVLLHYVVGWCYTTTYYTLAVCCAVCLLTALCSAVTVPLTCCHLPGYLRLAASAWMGMCSSMLAYGLVGGRDWGGWEEGEASCP